MLRRLQKPESGVARAGVPAQEGVSAAATDTRAPVARHRPIATIHVVNAAAALVLWLGSALAYPGLPGRFPIHFRGGEPDGWAARSVGAWFGLPATATALAIGMYALAALLRRYPQLINHPDAGKLRRLPQPVRESLARIFAGLFHRLATGLLLLFFFVQISLFVAAHGHDPTPLVALPIILSAPGTLILVATYLGKFQDALDRHPGR